MFSRVFKIILLVVVAISIAACSATPTRRSFKEGWKDSVVSTKVKFKLTGDKLVMKRNIDVDTWRGVVTMTGRVTSMEEKERAEQLAWQAKGVRGVDNYLKVVDDAYFIEQETAIAKASDTEKIEVAGTETIKIVEKKTPSHPVKSKVEGPVVFEEDVKTKEKIEMRATRGRYQKPVSSKIYEEDLTDEERLAQEAAEELRKLRGEDLSE